MISLVEFAETADIETSSDDYARRFSGDVGSWFLEIQEKATLPMLAPHPGARILDVGGGHGQLTHALLRNGYQVTILGSAEVCKQRIQKFLTEKNCAFEVGNILALPYAPQTFDIVISYRLLPHVTQWRQFVSELTRVARIAVIVDYPAVRSLNVLTPVLFQLKKRLEGNTRPYTSFWEARLIEVFRAAGFRRAERYPEFFLPMVFHRMVKLPRLSRAMESIFRSSGLTALLGSPVILKCIRARR